MANWRKRMEAGGGTDLRPGEALLAGIFLNPDGFTGSLVSKEVGGAVGSAIAQRRREAPAEATGLASVLPNERCWIGVTATRLLVWRHGAVRGRPRGLHTEMPVSDLRHVEVTRRRATYAVVLTFADGSDCRYEAPRVGYDPDGFAAAINDR